MAGNLLEIDNIDTYYGLAHVLHGISLSLAAGEAVALLGRNGAGKTTTLKSIMGLVPPRGGRIIYKGEDIAGLSPHVIARKGISLVPSGRHIFPALNVIEHLRVPVSASKNARKSLLKWVFVIFPELGGREKQKASSLSGGEQQMLVIARSLMTGPKLLLLDEPMEGLAPKLVRRVAEAMAAIQKEGITILLCEARLEKALLIAKRGYILETGRIVFQSDKDKLEIPAEIQRAYLGVGE
ncbi:High-affinity branched-chain amino acid transport ATP-binding protein LivF [subsurface metagenome]